jgi:hypothetical protein
VGQYVSRGGKQYYKGDDGKLYANFRDANLSSSPADQAIRGVGQALQGIPSTVQGAFANVGALLNTPVMRAAVGAPQNGPYDEWLNRPVSRGLVTSGDADLNGDPGRMFPKGSRTTDERNLPSGDRGRAPITSPNTTFQHADDEYNRLKSQFGGAPGVSQLAGMASLPTGFTPTGGKQAAGLKDYYAAQQEVGERNIGEITSALGYQKGSPMEQWARQHQGLAMEVFNKKFPAGAPTQGPGDEAIRAAISGGKFYPSEGSPSPVTKPPEFGTPANAVPAPPMQQGRAVSAPYDKAQAMAAQKTAGATGMPNFETTPEAQAPGKTWLGKVLSSPWGQSLMNTGGAMGIDYMQGIR